MKPMKLSHELPEPELLSKNDMVSDIEGIMQSSYLQYSLSVNIGRAIPDVRDGLIPCNRRILFAMDRQGWKKSHKTVKCAKVVGEVLGNFHPHGDSSVYGALVRLGQDFNMRQVLIDKQGNFGSIDGDEPAHYRYTECRLERISEELLADIDKDTVNMVPTFDESNVEPEVLPAKYPNLLVNGSVGIGVGMATAIPTHNLSEVIQATMHLLEHPEASVYDLMRYLPGPDFPTGGVIYGATPIREFYQTGHGTIKVRARAQIETDDAGHQKIIVTEVPYGVNKEMMVRRIGELASLTAIKEGKGIDGISGITDLSSDKTGILIVIDVKQTANAEVVLNKLYLSTQMETSIGCNMLVVDHNRPVVMNLVQVLNAFLDHRHEVVVRRAKFELDKAMARAHILEGLVIAVRNMDEVVKIIRASRSDEEAMNTLMERFTLTKVQARAILDMRLRQLTGLAIDDLLNEYNAVMARIKELNELLADPAKQNALIKQELQYVLETYGNPRRTDIRFYGNKINLKDLIPRHSCVITMTKAKYIKRMDVDEFKLQNRGGKGVTGGKLNDKDLFEHVVCADSHDLAFFFTDKGNMYWKNVYELPDASRGGKGMTINNLIDGIIKSKQKAMQNVASTQDGNAQEPVVEEENIRAILPFSEDLFKDPNISIVMVTKRGIVKRTPLARFKNLRNVALRYITLDEGDDLVSVSLLNGCNEVVLSSAMGMACRFKETDIRRMGRTARGVRGIRFKLEGDYVVGMEVVPSEELMALRAEAEAAAAVTGEEIPVENDAENDVENDEVEDAEVDDADVEDVEAEEAADDVADEAESTDDEVAEVVDDRRAQLLVITADGKGKRSYVDTYRLAKRGAKGVKNFRLSEGQSIVSALLVKQNDELLITTARGFVVRVSVSDINIYSRLSKGVKVMNLEKNDRIIAVSKIVDVPESVKTKIADDRNIYAGEGTGFDYGGVKKTRPVENTEAESAEATPAENAAEAEPTAEPETNPEEKPDDNINGAN